MPASARPVSRLHTATLLACAAIAVGLGVTWLALHRHRPRPLPAEWTAPVDFAEVHGLAAASHPHPR